MKTITMVLWSVILVLATAPTLVHAQFTFTINNGSITITGYTGPGGIVVIPTSINSDPVKNIGNTAFAYNTTLASVTIGSSVTNIGNVAFYSCLNLTSVTIGTNVTSIGQSAFSQCVSLTNVTIPNSVTSVGVGAFDNCTSLTNVTISSSITNIGDSAFADCTSLRAAQFQGNPPTTINNTTVFSGDNSVFAYYFFGTTSWGTNIDGIPAVLTGVTFTTNNGAITITRYTGLWSSVVIPYSLNGYPLANIGDGAFIDCTSVASVTIPNSVTNIGENAFQSCLSLTNAVISTNLINIANGAFSDCTQLKSVTIPNAVTSIGEFAFDGCTSLKNISVGDSNPDYSSINGVLFDKLQATLLQFPCGLGGYYTIPNSVTSIDYNAFEDCTSLTSVTIGNNVTNISFSAFSECTSLTSVTIGTNVTSIGEQAFYDCTSLTGFTIPNSITDIASSTFYACTRLLIVMIPNSVTSIDSSAFEGCTTLSGVTIPDSVINISSDAFAGCAKLASVIIPNNVTNIGVGAFDNCTSLTNALFLGNAPSVDGASGITDKSVFKNDVGTVYYVPGTTGWGTSFGSWPTASWYQPQPQILGTGFGAGVQSNGFQFEISWATNAYVVVLASTDLQNWTPLVTNIMVNGTNAFSDSTLTNYPQRFYRLRSP